MATKIHGRPAGAKKATVSSMSKKLRLFLAEYILAMGAYWVCTGFIIAKLTAYFTLPLGVSNLLTSLSSTFLILQPVGGVLYARTRRKRRYLLSLNVIWRLSIVLVFFAVLLPSAAGAALFCLFLLVMQAAQQVCSPAYEAWHVQAVESEHCATFYTTREVLFMLLYTVAMAAVQIAISLSERAGQLRSGFLCSGILEGMLLAASLVLLPRLTPPDEKGGEQPASLRAMLGVLGDRNHTRVICGNAFWSFANVFVGGLFSIYAVRVLEVDFLQLMVWGTVGNLLRMAFAPVFARIAARIGWKNCLADIFLVYAVLAVLLYFSTPDNAFWIVPVYLSLSALPVSGISIGTLQLRIATSPAALRSVYFSAYSLISGLASLIGTSVCSALLGLVETGALPLQIQDLFLIGLALIALPYLTFRRLPVDLH